MKNFDCLSLINFAIQFAVCMLEHLVDVWTGKTQTQLQYTFDGAREWDVHRKHTQKQIESETFF